MQGLADAVSIIIKIPPEQGIPGSYSVRQAVRATLLTVENAAPPVVQVREQRPLGELCCSTATVGGTMYQSASASLCSGPRTDWPVATQKKGKTIDDDKRVRTGRRKRWIRGLHRAHRTLDQTSRSEARNDPTHHSERLEEALAVFLAPSERLPHALQYRQSWDLVSKARSAMSVHL